MTFYLLILICLFMPLHTADEGTLFSRLSSSIGASCISFDYSFKTEVKGMPVNGKGHVTAQYPAFRAEGNGFMIFCDGETKWTSDTAAKEMVIERVSVSDEDLSSNPALLLYDMDSRFDLVSETVGSFLGKSVTLLELKSKDTSYVKSMILYVRKEDMSVSGAEVIMGDGSRIHIEINSFACNEKCPVTFFQFDEASLSSDYVITDLR